MTDILAPISRARTERAST